MRPFRFAVFEKLLEHRETDFAVIQCVAKIAVFVNPSRRDPRKRQAGELFDLVFATTRAGIGQNCHVRLIGDVEFFQHRAAVVAVVPNRDEIKFHLRIVLNDFEPAAALEFSLTIRTPRRPKMDDGELGRFDRFEDFLFSRRFGAQCEAALREA